MRAPGTMKILLVEDEYITAKNIQAALSEQNIICDISESAEEAFQIGKSFDYDAIIVDLGLPDSHGNTLIDRLRNAKPNTCILVLSGIHDTPSKIKSLSTGADDYMTKPFDTNELVARLYALRRRAEGNPASTIQVGKITVNLDAKTVELAGQLLPLTQKEYQVFEFMMLRKGAAILKSGFLNRLYNGLEEPEQKIIDVYICKIRKKMNKILPGSGSQYIHTAWGRGYMIKEPSVSVPPLSAMHELKTDNVRPLPLGRNG